MFLAVELQMSAVYISIQLLGQFKMSQPHVFARLPCDENLLSDAPSRRFRDNSASSHDNAS